MWTQIAAFCSSGVKPSPKPITAVGWSGSNARNCWTDARCSQHGSSAARALEPNEAQGEIAARPHRPELALDEGWEPRGLPVGAQTPEERVEVVVQKLHDD